MTEAEGIGLLSPTSDELWRLFGSQDVLGHLRQCIDTVSYNLWGFCSTHQGQMGPTEARPFLEEYFKTIESHVQRVVSNHSPAFWIILLRHARPLMYSQIGIDAAYDGDPQKLGQVSNVICALSEAMCLKYGNYDIADVMNVSSYRQVRLVRVTPTDILRAVQVFELAIAHDAVAECDRLAARGSAVEVYPKFPFVIQRPTEQMNLLLKRYQARGRFATAGSYFGSVLEPRATRRPVHRGLTLMAYQPANYHTHKSVPYVSRPFRLSQMDTQALWAFFSEFQGHFERVFRVAPLGFFATLIALHRWAWEQMQGPRGDILRHESEIHGLAGLPGIDKLTTTLASHVEKVACELGTPVNRRRAERLIQQALPALCYGRSDAIPLRVLSVSKPILPCAEGSLLDLTNSTELVQHLLDAVKISGGTEGDLKGRKFEDYLRQVLRKKCPRFVFWERGHEELQFPNGRGEFDAAVIVGDCMVLVEAKTFAISIKYLESNSRSLEERMSKLQEALTQVTDHANELARAPVTDTYALPKIVRYLIPVVCTPFPEWVEWESTDYWLTDLIPRICTPEELASYLRTCQPRQLKNLRCKISVNVT